jgi:hypothetical protein
LRQKNIRRLQVAVEDPAFMHGRDSERELARNLASLGLGHRADPAEERGQILAVDMLHRQEVLAADGPRAGAC